jgi:hypothetical protein
MLSVGLLREKLSIRPAPWADLRPYWRRPGNGAARRLLLVVAQVRGRSPGRRRVNWSTDCLCVTSSRARHQGGDDVLVREVSDVATGRRKHALLEPTVALTVADLPIAVGRVITDVLEQSLVAVDDMGLTTAAATLTGRVYWRNLSPVWGNRCPSGRASACRHYWGQPAPVLTIPSTAGEAGEEFSPKRHRAVRVGPLLFSVLRETTGKAASTAADGTVNTRRGSIAWNISAGPGMFGSCKTVPNS